MPSTSLERLFLLGGAAAALVLLLACRIACCNHTPQPKAHGPQRRAVADREEEDEEGGEEEPVYLALSPTKLPEPVYLALSPNRKKAGAPVIAPPSPQPSAAVQPPWTPVNGRKPIQFPSSPPPSPEYVQKLKRNDEATRLVEAELRGHQRDASMRFHQRGEVEGRGEVERGEEERGEEGRGEEYVETVRHSRVRQPSNAVHGSFRIVGGVCGQPAGRGEQVHAQHAASEQEVERPSALREEAARAARYKIKVRPQLRT